MRASGRNIGLHAVMSGGDVGGPERVEVDLRRPSSYRQCQHVAHCFQRNTRVAAQRSQGRTWKEEGQNLRFCV